MKKYYLLIILIAALLRVSAGDLSSNMLVICRNIELGLYPEFLSKNRSLPNNLNEIKLLREIAARNPSSGMLLNEMAVVPGAPVISKAPGIPSNHNQWRVFVIGRTINTDYGSKTAASGDRFRGRYTVWISPDGKYCSPGWTPETVIQAALKQIGGFDPSTQPVAFPEAENMFRDNMERKRKLREEFRDDLEKAQKRTPKEEDDAKEDGKLRGFPLLVLGLSALVLLAGLAVMVRRRKRVS